MLLLQLPWYALLKSPGLELPEDVEGSEPQCCTIKMAVLVAKLIDLC